MAQVFNRIEMDIGTKIPDIITAVQNDSNSRFLDVFLFDGSTPINLTGHEVRIYCRKPENGGEVFNNGEITEPTNGRCQFPLTDQTLAKVGYVEAQIVIYYQNVQVLQSHPFNISVVESLISSGSVESSNEYGALVVLYQNLYEAYDLMTTMVQTFGLKGQISADRNINTFWQSLEYVAKYLDTDIKNLLDTVLAEANVHGVIDRLGNAADTGATATTGTVMGKVNSLIGQGEFGFLLPLMKMDKKTVVSNLGVAKFRFDGKKRVKRLYIICSTSNLFTINITIDGVTTPLITTAQDFATKNYPVYVRGISKLGVSAEIKYEVKRQTSDTEVTVETVTNRSMFYYEFDVDEYFEVEFYSNGTFGSDITRTVSVEYLDRG